MNASLPCGIKGRYPKNAIAKANNFSIINVKIFSQIYLSCHYNNLLTVFKITIFVGMMNYVKGGEREWKMKQRRSPCLITQNLRTRSAL